MKVYKQTGRFEIDQEEKEKTIQATVVRTRYTLYTVHTVQVVLTQPPFTFPY